MIIGRDYVWLPDFITRHHTLPAELIRNRIARRASISFFWVARRSDRSGRRAVVRIWNLTHSRDPIAEDAAVKLALSFQ